MTAVWPGTLRQSLMLQGVGEQWLDRYQESSMNIGTPKRRLRFTGDMREVNGMVLLDLMKGQMTTWLTFFRTTLNYGALPFTWVSPLTGETVTYLIGSKPSYSALSPTLWKVSLKLRVIP